MRRAAMTCGEPEVMTMPGVTRVLQLGTNPLALSTCTRQTQHEAYGSRRRSWQRVGILMPWLSATSRMVFPGSTSSFFPSSVISIVSAAIVSPRHGAPRHFRVPRRDFDGIEPAGLEAQPALDAGVLVYDMSLLPLAVSGLGRTDARAQHAAGAGLGEHVVADERLAFLCGAALVPDMVVVLRAEVSQRGEHGIGRRLAQPAEGRHPDLCGQVL